MPKACNLSCPGERSLQEPQKHCWHEQIPVLPPFPSCFQKDNLTWNVSSPLPNGKQPQNNYSQSWHLRVEVRACLRIFSLRDFSSHPSKGTEASPSSHDASQVETHRTGLVMVKDHVGIRKARVQGSFTHAVQMGMWRETQHWLLF